MRLLLDTHAFLWAAQEPSKLSPAARTAITDLGNELFVSAISSFEISTKSRLGKLPGYESVVETYPAIVARLRAEDWSVSSTHARFAGRFEWQHRDPFDRILAAQAACDDLTLVTADRVFSTLTWVKTLW